MTNVTLGTAYSAKSLSEISLFGKEPIKHRPRFIRRTGLLALLAIPLALAFAAPADATTGDLTQKPGTAGCVVEDTSILAVSTCADGRALHGAASITISPDGNGKSLYVASSQSDAIAVFGHTWEDQRRAVTCDRNLAT